MASNLDFRTVQYILSQFDAGVLPGQIFRALESSGGNFVSIQAIEECLRNNGRGQFNYQAKDALRSHREPSRASSSANHSSSNAYTGSQTYATGSIYADQQHGSALYPGARAAMPYTPCDQQRHPGRTQASTNNYSGSLRPTLPRDVHADQLIISAYQEGITVRETVNRLMRAGYAVTATEVVACLNANGLGTVRVIDYTRR